jgi:hypothetical protein
MGHPIEYARRAHSIASRESVDATATRGAEVDGARSQGVAASRASRTGIPSRRFFGGAMTPGFLDDWPCAKGYQIGARLARTTRVESLK